MIKNAKKKSVNIVTDRDLGMVKRRRVGDHVLRCNTTNKGIKIQNGESTRFIFTTPVKEGATNSLSGTVKTAMVTAISRIAQSPSASHISLFLSLLSGNGAGNFPITKRNSMNTTKLKPKGIKIFTIASPLVAL